MFLFFFEYFKDRIDGDEGIGDQEESFIVSL